MMVDISSETLKIRTEWDCIFKLIKKKNYQVKILYPAKLSFKNVGERKIFLDEQKLRKIVATSPGMKKKILPVRGSLGWTEIRDGNSNL